MATDGARVCIVSQRGFRPEVARCGAYEFEDVIGAVDQARLVTPAPCERPFPRWVQRGLLRLHRRTGVCVTRDARVPPVAVPAPCELLFVMTQSPRDLESLALTPGWRERCRVAAVLVEEVWVRGLQWRRQVEQLRAFDHLFTYCHGTREALEEATGRPCHYVAPATDALRFCPYPNPPERCIDFYCMGRRSPETHASLLPLTHDHGFHYLYDSVQFRCYEGPYTDHRALLAQRVMRTRYFHVCKAKANRDQDTGGQEEVGPRYLEGAAGGAVLVGDVPRSGAFDLIFGWPDAVIEAPFGSRGIARLIAEMEAQPERVASMRRTHLLHSLTRHDWSHRWEEILRVTGLEPLPALRARQARLVEVARAIEGAPVA